jgi:hypothetical protein
MRMELYFGGVLVLQVFFYRTLGKPELCPVGGAIVNIFLLYYSLFLAKFVVSSQAM